LYRWSPRTHPSKQQPCAFGEKAKEELLNCQPLPAVLLLIAEEERVSTDGNSFLESFAAATATWVSTVIDNYGWILPALFLTALLLGVIVLVAWIAEDIPFDVEIFQGIGGIFKWARTQWGPPKTVSINGFKMETTNRNSEGPP
jgi:hypothetical protein